MAHGLIRTFRRGRLYLAVMRFYRYFDSVGGEATLKSRRMRWADPKGFNDPFELLPRMKPPTKEEAQATLLLPHVIEKYYQSEGKPCGLTRQQSEEKYRAAVVPAKLNQVLKEPAKAASIARRQLLPSFSHGFRILCGSHTHESVLMWSHYADKHRGIVIEIESSEMISDLSLDAGTLEVVYRSSPPTLPPMPWSDGDWLTVIPEVLRTKALFWSYEEEVRIQLPLVPEFQLDENGGMEFQPRAVKSVIIGCRAEPDFEGRICDTLKHSDYSHVQILKAGFHDQDYKLSFAQLNAPPSP